MTSEPQPRRPWTIYALTILAAAGPVWGLAIGGIPDVWEMVNLVIGLWAAYSIWTGKGWVFTLMFMLVSLCAVLAIGVAVVQLLLLEQSVHSAVWWTLGGSAVWILLLMHRSTKAFARIEDAPARPARWTARTGRTNG